MSHSAVTAFDASARSVNSRPGPLSLAAPSCLHAIASKALSIEYSLFRTLAPGYEYNGLVFLLPPHYCGLAAGSIPFRAIVNNKQCETRGLLMSLAIHC